ncbi:MAG: hypothetical protein G3M70_17720 [Candidatus Nitronauta litoralis]|uniref:ABC-type glycine betaine transport system substrate-binding domain-containing protein n=1 Tax=Candidatus Nitronauta litoralis TaxID=2705533 RepID=A0A7T0BZ46_9BACT|nr:MAG: hypothetical protein G3M70_17720 [Candidatus Nitronauta litoralis]
MNDSPISNRKSNQGSPDLLEKIVITFVIAMELLILFLLVQELRESGFRATDKVLILLGIAFIPVLFEIIRRFLRVSKFVNFKVGELEVNINRAVDEKVQLRTKTLERDLEGKLSTAEQALYPILGGPNHFAKDRLDKGTLIISSKDFPANIVAVKLLTSFLKYEKQEGRLKINEINEIIPIGGTLTNYAAIKNGWVDLIIDYTGTGCLFFNVNYHTDNGEIKTEESILDTLREVGRERFQSQWFKPIGTMTNYCLVVKEEAAKESKQKITKISDLEFLEKDKPVRLATDFEFSKRQDGFLGLKERYNHFGFETVVCSFKERYEYLEYGKAEVGLGHTTDSEIQENGLRILEDDKEFFPNYSEVPIARLDALKFIEGLEDALNKFSTLGIKNKHLTRLIKNYNRDSSSIDKRASDVIKELTANQ